MNFSMLIAAPWSGRVGARGIQQSLYSNPYLPALYLVGGQGSFALTDALWQSLDGGITWSPLGSNPTLGAIPTFQGSAVSLLVNDVLAIYGGQLANGTATSFVATSSTLFASYPLLYTAPFAPRYNHAYTTIPGTNTTVFRAGLTSTGFSTTDCWKATNPELGPSTWIQQTSTGPFPASLGNSALVTLYDAYSTLLLCGGAAAAGSVNTAINTCWASLNVGVSWSAGIAAAWSPRAGLVATSDLNGWAYVYGGYNPTTIAYYYDLWITTNRAITWTLVTFPGQSLSIQNGCFALYYTQQYLNGGFITEPQFLFFSGFSANTNSSVMGSYLAPESISGGVVVIPALAPFTFSSDVISSECQFTFNVAGTLTGFGVSSANPNAALSASNIALLVGVVLGIPASAVQVCVHVSYASPLTQRGEVYLFSGNLGSVNMTTLVANVTASTGTNLLSIPKSISITSAEEQWWRMDLLSSTRRVRVYSLLSLDSSTSP